MFPQRLTEKPSPIMSSHPSAPFHLSAEFCKGVIHPHFFSHLKKLESQFFFQALSVKMCPLSGLKIAGFHLSAKTSSYLGNRSPTEHLLRKSLFLDHYNGFIPRTLKGLGKTL